MNLSLRRFFQLLARRFAAPAVASVLIGAASVLAGCGSVVGNGNGPIRVFIVQPGSETQLATLKMYQCLTSGLGAVVQFNNGQVGNFTARVKWTSSNTGAVQVSNGDIQIPGSTSFYPAGTLVPRGTGTSVVTADYFGLMQQIAISVGTPQNIHLTYLQNGLYRPLYQVNLDQPAPRSDFSMGVGSIIQLAVLATLDGQETDVSSFADFHFQVPSDGVATLGATTGILTAISAGGPLVPVADFPPCALDNITDPNGIVDMTVQQILDINLRSELAANPQQPISVSNPVTPVFLGNSERIYAVADLANGDKQDITSQTTLSTDTSNFAAFGTPGILSATAPGGPVVMSGVYTAGGHSLQTSSYSTSVQNGQLGSILVCWSDPLDQDFSVYTAPACKDPTDPAYAAPDPSSPTVTGGSLTPLQFHAIGVYGENAAGTGLLYQEVTRGTTWTPLDTKVVTLGTSVLNIGQAKAVTLSQTTTEVTATDAAATNLGTVVTHLTVLPANLSGEGDPLP